MLEQLLHFKVIFCKWTKQFLGKFIKKNLFTISGEVAVYSSNIQCFVVLIILCFSASHLLLDLASDAATLLDMRSKVLDYSGLISTPAPFQKMISACPVACG